MPIFVTICSQLVYENRHRTDVIAGSERRNFCKLLAPIRETQATNAQNVGMKQKSWRL